MSRKLIDFSKFKMVMDIRNNPQATEKEIIFLCEIDPIWALEHPNCHEAIWWYLASQHPLQAIHSPAGQLFLLASPERWLDIQDTNQEAWVKTFGPLMSDLGQYEFMIHSMERLFTPYEIAFPDLSELLTTFLQIHKERFARGESPFRSDPIPVPRLPVEHSAISRLLHAASFQTFLKEAANAHGILQWKTLGENGTSGWNQSFNIEVAWQWQQILDWHKKQPGEPK